MKKILPLLSFAFFFSSCPIMEDTNESGVWFRIKNMTEKTLNFNVKYEIPSYSSNFDVHKDSVTTNSICSIHGIDFLENTKHPLEFLKETCRYKEFIVSSLSGDTLANWNDSSAIFDPKYWVLETQRNGDVHCTLQLTDEVLELK